MCIRDRLKHVLRAKAVLCAGLEVSFGDENTGEFDTWSYKDGLKDYLEGSTKEWGPVPLEPFVGTSSFDSATVDWAVQWLPEGGDLIQESYVNLIPTIFGRNHVNAFRSGIIDAMRDFCLRRSLLPKNIKLSPEDMWKNASFIISFKMSNPQFSGQTKGKLQSNNILSSITSQLKDKFE